MNPELMTEKLQRVLIDALTMCKEANNPELCSEHMIAAFLKDDDIKDLLNSFHTNVNQLINITDNYLNKLPSSDSNSDPSVNRYVAQSFNEALNKSKQRKDKYVSLFDMFITTLFNNSSVSLSPSFLTADNNIPLDSKPLILRGFKFITATTFLPTKSSGL